VIALGWGPLSATIASAAATFALAAIFGIPHGIGYVIGVALPSWWLGHLALLGRPVASSGNGAAAPDIEWYPVGRILVWIAGFASLTTFCALLTLGTDATAILAAMKQGLLRILEVRGTAGDEKLLDALVTIMPACGVIGIMITLTINLWLTGKITAMSGRLRRPWPDLKTAALPKAALAALCVATACSLAVVVLIAPIRPKEARRTFEPLSLHSLLAGIRFVKTAKGIESDDAVPSPGERMDLALAVLLGLLGVALFLYLSRAVLPAL